MAKVWFVREGPDPTTGRPITLRAIIEASCWNPRCPSRLQNHLQNQFRASHRFAPLTSHPRPSRHCQIDEEIVATLKKGQ
jgi:hypothetical protein